MNVDIRSWFTNTNVRLWLSFDFAVDQLIPKEINLHEKDNRHSHHTDKYEHSNLIVRRGQNFDVTVTFNRAYDARTDVITLQFAVGKKRFSQVLQTWKKERRPDSFLSVPTQYLKSLFCTQELVKIVVFRRANSISRKDPWLDPLYHYMRNFCNLIGLEQWYFCNQLNLKYLHGKITTLLRVVV